ncbi:MAG TPA: Smr/MutS family protein [Caulobacteraceae bacterium]|nr:Smr/MutS family protein [Caulobacteraceae bacterium]
MRRADDHDGARLWAVVTRTIRPFPGRSPAPPPTASLGGSLAAPAKPLVRGSSGPARKEASGPVPAIEPGRRRKLEKAADPASRLDLHGQNHDGARDLLTRFILLRHAEGRRSVLVITGRGALGQGVLRRYLPEWLAQPPLRGVVAGVSEAHRRHGGEGAFYVALKRLSRG